TRFSSRSWRRWALVRPPAGCRALRHRSSCRRLLTATTARLDGILLTLGTPKVRSSLGARSGPRLFGDLGVAAHGLLPRVLMKESVIAAISASSTDSPEEAAGPDGLTCEKSAAKSSSFKSSML